VDAKRRAELERQVPDAADGEYRAFLAKVLTEQTARYVSAASECRREKSLPREAAKQHGLHEELLAEWIAFLNRIEKDPERAPAELREIAAGKLAGPALAKAAAVLQESFAKQAKQIVPEKPSLAHAELLHFRADDPQLAVDASGKVTRWPNRAGFSGDALPPMPSDAPLKTTVKIGNNTKPVLRFDGKSILEMPRTVPPVGSLFIVFQSAAAASERIIGWEDSDVGRHGLGLMTGPSGQLQAILRNNGQTGDLLDTKKPAGFETVSVTWGPAGTSIRRNDYEHIRNGFHRVSSDPKISALKIGGPGSGGASRFRGDIAELRVYSRQLNDTERKQVEAELHHVWFEADDPNRKPTRDPLAELYFDLLSPRGPFWPFAAERSKRLPATIQKKLAAMTAELAALRSKRPLEIPQAVAVQEGGPKDTRHEGFQDAHVFIRGDHKRLGRIVPRGFPKILTGDREVKITAGSGRLQLADWLVRPDHPLTARVMVNRIWQHHFGDGLVRTPNDFGERGDRPTHPDLLDFLAARFVESGWSVKAMHRLIMNSAAYQQGSHASAAALAGDPENRLFGRMNRRRLDAEAIRDSLLAVSGQLDLARGGPAFTDLAVPRRTLYLMSARTGANTSDFGRLFDRADPSLIVAQRGQSIVAPQALFFLNDPFVSGIA
ncbi:MAG TPA: DUF1553 domain-containing protein, partial [Urbifossiella sp.]